MRQIHALLDTCADLHSQRYIQHLAHAANNLLELGGAVHEGTAPTLLVHKVNGAANVDVHEVHFNGAIQELRTLGHGVGKGTLKLNPEDVLALMAFEQGPLGRLALQQVGAHGHLATRHVRPEAFTDPPEGQVPTRGERGQVQLAADV